MDTKDETISYLTRKLLDTKKQRENLHNRLNHIQSILYSIGGPLNDNVLKYSPKQLSTFVRINKAINGVENEY